MPHDQSVLDLLFDSAKILKCSLVTIKGSYIIGTDEQFAHLSCISHKEPELWSIDNIPFGYTTKGVESFEKDLLCAKKFNNLINLLESYKQYPISLLMAGLENVPEFKDIMAKKAAEGISLFKGNNYIISINKSLLPVNKNDKVDLTIRDIDNSKFLAEFKLTKGSKQLYKYFMYLKI